MSVTSPFTEVLFDFESGGKIYTGPIPCMSVDLKHLNALKIDHIISVGEEQEVKEYYKEPIAALYQQHHFAVSEYPIAKSGPVDLDVLEYVSSKITIRVRDEGQRILIHGLRGKGRTGMVVAAVAMRVFGFTPNEAMTWTRQYVQGAVETDSQEQALFEMDLAVPVSDARMYQPPPLPDINALVAASNDAWNQWVSTAEIENEPNATKQRVITALAAEYDAINVLSPTVVYESKSILSNTIRIGSRDFLAHAEPYRAAERTALWLNILDTRIPLIIKLAKSKDRRWIRQKSLPEGGYWGLSTHYWKEYGSLPNRVAGLQVKHVDTQFVAKEICVRTFEVRRKGIQGVHQVTQLEFRDWPDLGVPYLSDLHPFLKEARTRIDALPADVTIAVHCGMGKGRTGTFLTALAAQKMTKRAQIPALLTNLRTQRAGLIETVDQYLLVHRILYSSTHPNQPRRALRTPAPPPRQPMDRWTGFEGYQAYVSHKAYVPLKLEDESPRSDWLWALARELQANPSLSNYKVQLPSGAQCILKPDGKESIFMASDASEWERTLAETMKTDIARTRDTVAECIVKNLGSQLNKEYRSLESGAAGYSPEEYRVSVGSRKFLAFAEPSGITAREDFWAAVLENKSPLVVKLVGERPGVFTHLDGNWHVGAGHNYWPRPGESLCVGRSGITVTNKAEKEKEPGIVLRQLEMRKGTKSHTVFHLDFANWPDMGVPTISDLQSLIEVTERVALGFPGQPITVHCGQGRGRTGTFLAALGLGALSDRKKIPLLIQQMRGCRYGLVETEGQYRLLHQLYYAQTTSGAPLDFPQKPLRSHIDQAPV
jgi:protein tyrosine phosphatase